MKHIIVTTPKREMEAAANEAKHCIDTGGGYYFRNVGKRKPKGIIIGKSKIYYVEDGFIRGRGTIVGITDGKGKCSTTGRIWGDEGSAKVLTPASSWEWIEPIPMKGFQGWRYYDDKDIEVVGTWKDKKPTTKKVKE